MDELMELKKYIYNEILEIREHYKQLSNAKRIDVTEDLTKIKLNYNSILECYFLINEAQNEEDVRDVREKVVQKATKIRDNYNGLSEVEKASSKIRYDGYLHIIDLIDKYLVSINDKTVKKEKKAITEEKPIIKKIEVPNVKKEANKSTTKPTTESVHAFINISREISQKKLSYFKLNTGSEEEKKARIELYNLCKQREDLLYSYLGEEGFNISRNIESLEDSIYSRSQIKIDNNYVLNESSLISRLNDRINKINELGFNGINNTVSRDTFNSLLVDLENIVTSLSKVDKSLIVDYKYLVGVLSTVNLSGGYSRFAKKYEESSIGNTRINNKAYNKMLSDLKKLIVGLVNKCTLAIKKMSGKVAVTNSSFDFKNEEAKLSNAYGVTSVKIENASRQMK